MRLSQRREIFGGVNVDRPNVEAARREYGKQRTSWFEGAYLYGANSESFISKRRFDVMGSHQYSASNEVDPNVTLYDVKADSDDGELGLLPTTNR